MFNIIILVLGLGSISLISIFLLIFRDINRVDYKVNSESTIEKEAEKNYLSKYPNYTIYSLKSEIEKIADILIDNQESNRYTELLREKASKDENIKKLKNAVIEDVDIIKYNKGNLKARLKYKDYDFDYSMILNLSTVARGRVFLNNYLVYKEKVTN